MPYINDQDRCDSHIRYIKRQIASIERAQRKLPKLVTEMAYWSARKKMRLTQTAEPVRPTLNPPIGGIYDVRMRGEREFGGTMQVMGRAKDTISAHFLFNGKLDDDALEFRIKNGKIFYQPHPHDIFPEAPVTFRITLKGGAR